MADCMIVELVDSDGESSVVLARVARLWHFSVFRYQREVLVNVCPDAFMAFLDFLENKDEPYTLEIFQESDLFYAIPHLVTFLHNNLTQKERENQKMSDFYDFTVKMMVEIF